MVGGPAEAPPPGQREQELPSGLVCGPGDPDRLGPAGIRPSSTVVNDVPPLALKQKTPSFIGLSLRIGEVAAVSSATAVSSMTAVSSACTCISAPLYVGGPGGPGSGMLSCM